MLLDVVNDFISTLKHREDTFGKIVNQKVYIREEIAEVLKEFSKDERNKGNSDHIIEEEIDLITTLFEDLIHRGLTFEMILVLGDKKINNAIARYKRTGEL